MASKYVGTVCLFGRCMQNNLPLMSRIISYPNNNGQPVRCKHWDPRYKADRKRKVFKVTLPKAAKKSVFNDYTPQEKLMMQMYGILPEKMYPERSVYVGCSRQIFDSYIIPEGDGKYSTISKEGALQKLDVVKQKGVSTMAIRKIKRFDDFFSTTHFSQEALEIYIKAHEALTMKNKQELLKYATDTAYEIMIKNTLNKTIHWKYLQSLEPPRIVHARCQSIMIEDNIFAQITIRLHSQQMLAIYDRFGRLMQGSEILAKDVLEYVVFEKHLSDSYGVWRLHGKIKPPWISPTECAKKTYVQPPKKSAKEVQDVTLADGVSKPPAGPENSPVNPPTNPPPRQPSAP